MNKEVERRLGFDTARSFGFLEIQWLIISAPCDSCTHPESEGLQVVRMWLSLEIEPAAVQIRPQESALLVRRKAAAARSRGVTNLAS